MPRWHVFGTAGAPVCSSPYTVEAHFCGRAAEALAVQGQKQQLPAEEAEEVEEEEVGRKKSKEDEEEEVSRKKSKDERKVGALMNYSKYFDPPKCTAAVAAAV